MAEKKQSDHAVKWSIRRRLALAVGLMMFVTVIVAGGALVYQLGQLALNTQNLALEHSLTSLFRVAEHDIRGEDVLAVLETQDMNSPAAQRITETLFYLDKVEGNLGWSYVVVPDEDSESGFRFLLLADTFINDDPLLLEEEFLQPYLPLDEAGDTDLLWMQDSMDGEIVYAPIWYEGEDGNIWLNGFGPIRDESGNVVALIGADLEAIVIDDVNQTIFRVVLITFIAGLPIAFIAIHFMAETLVRPIASLVFAAQNMEDEEVEYDETILKPVVTRSDEMGQLARVFNRMALEVKKREKKMKAKLQKLTIEIDLMKKDQHVAEITESDFFKDLKAKSDTMRRNRNEEDSENKEG